MPNLKGDRAVEELIGEDADAPNVYFAVVGTLADDFWRRVNRRAALCVPQERGMNGPAEVTYFNGVFVQENVLRFEIAMEDVIGVHVFHSCTNLTNPFFDCLL